MSGIGSARIIGERGLLLLHATELACLFPPLAIQIALLLALARGGTPFIVGSARHTAVDVDGAHDLVAQEVHFAVVVPDLEEQHLYRTHGLVPGEARVARRAVSDVHRW